MATMLRRWLPAVSAAVLLLSLPSPADGHILTLVRSFPAANDTVCPSSGQVIAVFSGELDVKESRFALESAAGQAVGEGRVDLNDVERSRLLLTLPATLTPGRYVVRWRVVSNDDKQETLGDIPFTVQECLDMPWRTLALGGLGLSVLVAVAVVVSQRRQNVDEDAGAAEDADAPSAGAARD